MLAAATTLLSLATGIYLMRGWRGYRAWREASGCTCHKFGWDPRCVLHGKERIEW